MFKNKDGTVNALPIVLIFTFIAISIYLLLFGVEIKRKVDDVVNDLTTTTTKTTETPTIKICNGCSMNFISDSFDFSTNASVDVKEIINVNKIGVRNIDFTSSNPGLVSINSHSNTFNITTSNQNGSATITAKYADITISAIINVVNPSSGSVEFKYSDYFIAQGESFAADIITRPYGLNIDDATYKCNNDKVSTDEHENNFSGYEIGTSVCTITKGGKKTTANIHVVYDNIRVRINESGEYKEARTISPSGNSFDIQISLDNKTKNNFDHQQIQTSWSRNDLNATITYIGPAPNINTWNYHIELNGTGKSILRIDLPDESTKPDEPHGHSFMLFEINK